ncbi:MAG: acyltransferase [Hyphomonadaceae bacterium]|nr:acyltransferase [Hyphomonadaceae bacterium]
MTGRIFPLDGWRGLAISAVLVGHFFPVPGINLGTLGVELFFVLSGRLMADILFVKKLPLGEFFYRRVTRILPALLVFVAAFWIVAEMLGEPFSLSPLWVVAAGTFTLNYLAVFAHHPGWFDHLWSLCVEEHAYMLLGLIAYLFGRSSGRPVVVVWVLGAAAMLNGVFSFLVLHMEYDDVYWRSDVHVASIFLSGGIYLALRQSINAETVKRFATPVFLAALTGGVLFSLEAAPLPLNYTLGTLCFCVAVALCDIAAKPIVAALSWPGLTQVGLWSYSLYLWQQPFYKAYGLYPEWKLAMLAGAIAMGIASYYFVERPARRWLNSLWGRWGRKVAAST